MRNLLAHVLGAALLLGSGALTGCVIEAHGSAHAGATHKPARAKAPAKKDPEPAATTTHPKTAPVASTKTPQQTAPTTNFEMENGALKLPGPVLFETGKDVLKPESDAVLQVVHDYMAAKPGVTLLRVEGHTDNVGNASDNQVLSERRSMAVARWLINSGISCKRLVPVGFGDRKPVASNTTEDGRAQNRRTMFVNAEIKGKPIGGMPVDGGGTVAGDPCK